ncbi:GAF domain-containing protein [Neobacillus notoginsengisoli]|uniref:GAF domain-containing protein n=1 Tax=Neobacillus notoginsengisoli TaxID=1578198 RepID=A0A417YW81_9BACI|nr:GAF domain-containing protein [Neobacillus notoginsengisoli]RHW41511.1 GAF domain-containing protein [Neobacillus notoginsengisoli]
MEELRGLNPVIEKITELREEIGCDFVGLAIQNKVGPDIRWHFASGNLNDKYERITVRYGKGVAGKVVSTGSPILVENFPQNILGKATDYPIMLAEKLKSSYAVPLFFNGVPKGVLLAGNRSNLSFSVRWCSAVRETAAELEKILEGYHLL